MTMGGEVGPPEFHILGPLRVLVCGREVALGGPKERALLALLLVEANRPLGLDRLAEDLWGDSVPERAAAALRVHVSHIRRALGAAGAQTILTSPLGYELRVHPEQLDASHFERLAAEGHAQLHEGRPDRAAVRLRDALALWRGPALADVADATFAGPEIARLEELRVGAIEARVEADLACGRHTELVGELGSLVDAHPLRERLWAARILALHRAGRQAEALGAYQEVRRRLGEELGLEPGPALAALDRAVATRDPSLDLDAPPGSAAPRPGAGPVDPPAAAPVEPPLPGALAGLCEPGFVGRDAEVARLESAGERARAGACQVALVAGEPGVGKTALAVRMAAGAARRGATVLFGRCDEESLVPFQPFVEALAHHVETVAPEKLRAQLGGQAADLALLVPQLRRRLPELAGTAPTGAATERWRLFEAVPTLLRAMGADAPVVLLLDDLHWADRPTLQLLQHLIRRGADVPLLIVGTYRDTDLVRTHPMAEALVDLRRSNAVDRLQLRGLTRDDVVALVASGAEVGPAETALADALWRQTDGSPLFLREILRHLAETGAIVREEGSAWVPRRRVDQLGIPEGVKEVIGRRLTRLSDVANVALRTASVMGRTFRLDVLEAVTDHGGDALLDALEEAAAAGVVVELRGAPGRYDFTHALVRDALYDELSLTRRVRLHQRVGEALEALVRGDPGPHLAELAYHFSQAAVAAGPQRAIDYGRRAGDHALRHSACEEAARHFAVALEVAEDAGAAAGVRADLLLSMGRAHWRAGDGRVARAAFERAVAITGASDPERLARAALGYAGAGVRWFWVDLGRVNGRAIALLESALAAMPEEDGRSRARLLACLAQSLYWSPESEARREQVSAEAVAMARRLGDPTTLAEALCARSLATNWQGNAADRLAAAAEALEIAAALDDPELAAFGYGHRGVAHGDLGDLDAMWCDLEDLERVAQLNRDSIGLGMLLFPRAGKLLLEGRLDDAEALALEGLRRLYEAGDPNGFALYTWVIFLIRILQGRPEEVIHLPSGINVHYPAMEGAAHGLAALCHAMLGREVPARRELAMCGSVPHSALWMSFVSLLCLVYGRLGDAERAVAAYSSLLPYADRHVLANGIAGFGPVSLALAIAAAAAGMDGEAERHFEHALATASEHGWPVVVAHAQAGLALMLAARGGDGDHARARELASGAASAASALGLRGVAADAARALAGLDGAAPRPAAAAAPRLRDMTVRERLRAGLTARGRSAVARLTRGDTDEELARRFGSALAQRALFTAMAHAFQPSRALGFEGALVFELIPSHDGTDPAASDWWTIEVHGRSATARRGRAATASVTLHVGLADFARLGSGELHPVEALVERRFAYEGDVLLASRLAEMFGAVEPPDLPEL